MKNNIYVIPFSILAAGLFISAIVISTTWRYNAKLNQTITVTGSAKKDITSDLGFLRGTISAYASTPGAAYQQLNTQKPILIDYFINKGIPKDKITLSTIIEIEDASTNISLYQVSAA